MLYRNVEGVCGPKGLNVTELDIALKAVEIYATRHPRPSQVSQKQACEMLGISQPTLRKLIKHGTLRLNECGLIPTTEVDRLLA